MSQTSLLFESYKAIPSNELMMKPQQDFVLVITYLLIFPSIRHEKRQRQSFYRLNCQLVSESSALKLGIAQF